MIHWIRKKNDPEEDKTSSEILERIMDSLEVREWCIKNTSLSDFGKYIKILETGNAEVENS